MIRADSRDDFLQAVFGIGTTSSTDDGPLPERSAAPNPFVSLAVPVDCDPSLWASFVDSSLWSDRPVGTDDEVLYSHYVDNLPNEVVARDGPGMCGVWV